MYSPTFKLKPGDTFTLTVINTLAPDTGITSSITNCDDDLFCDVTGAHVMNTLHSPNTTNVHTHGLHIDPYVDDVLNVDPLRSLLPAHFACVFVCR